LFHHAVDLSESIAEGRHNDEQRVMVDDRFRRHPVTGCSAGYDICQAAKPNWTPVAAFEFMALTAAFAFQAPVNAQAAAEFSSLASACMFFLQTGPDVAAREVEQHKARLRDPRAAYETAFRFQRYDGANWQWVPDTEVEEANGYAVLAAFITAEAETCELIRDVFANPFRAVALDSGWRTPKVTALAQAIYDERSFDRLPVLADALEEAGCHDADILNHCRRPGPHARGCWVVDLILGRQ
jgi:hypothetical protein